MVRCTFPILPRRPWGSVVSRLRDAKHRARRPVTSDCPRAWICISSYPRRLALAGIRVARESTERLGILRLPQKVPTFVSLLIWVFTWLQAH